MFFDIAVAIIAIYILSSLCFGVFYSSSENFAFPVLLKPFLLFSIFTVGSILWFLCFNFDIFSSDSTTLFYGQMIQLIFLFVCTLVLFNTRDFVSDNKILKFEYDLLFSFTMLSALCLCFSDDFLNVYVAIELQSLALYVFATFNRKSEFSTESGLKYFVFGAIISCFLLLGFSFIYLTFGTTSFNTLFSLVYTSDDILLFLGILFILIALLFKIGAVPFHA
jgi:NADH-quinone oxidoreductase subunit N